MDWLGLLAVQGTHDSLLQHNSKTSILRHSALKVQLNLFDDNIDIFADLTVKPKEKSKKKVEAKSIFDDDTDDIFSSGIQTKTTKSKSRSSETVTESRSGQKVSNIFDDPLNAFGGQ